MAGHRGVVELHACRLGCAILAAFGTLAYHLFEMSFKGETNLIREGYEECRDGY